MSRCTLKLFLYIFYAVLNLPMFIRAEMHQPLSGGETTPHGKIAFVPAGPGEPATDRSKRLNVFVFSKEKKSTLAGFSIRTNAWFARLFNKRLKAITISRPEDLPVKMKELMDRHPGYRIGNLWFDSHGSYRAGYSLFLMGFDTVDHRRVDSPRIRAALDSVSRYCDEQSFVTIGSCYASADYTRPANQYLPSTPMNGDSLMLAVSRSFPNTPILGSESWVMTKPFMFGSRTGINGFPFAKHFRDTIFRPVWERLGQWKQLSPGGTSPEPVRSVSLSGGGDIRFNERDYLDKERARRKQKKHLSNLEPDLYGNAHPK